MKLSKEITDIIRKKFIEKIELTKDEATKWNAYLTSMDRAIKRKAYEDATPEQRIAIRKQTNDAFSNSCAEARQAAVKDRAFWQSIIQMFINAAATALLAKAEDM